MVTVAIHEIGHGIGFLSNCNSNGSSVFGGGLGTPGLYSEYDRFLQRGNAITTPLIASNITQPSTFATFTGDSTTLRNGNDTSTGLWFGGKYAREVFGGAVPLWAPPLPGRFERQPRQRQRRDAPERPNT